jgi:hypothetical protein
MDGTPGVIGSWANMKATKDQNDETNGNTAKTHSSTRARNPYANLESPEAWWSKVPPGQRRFMQELAIAIAGVDEVQRLEIRKERGVYRVRYIELVDKFEEGCVPVVTAGQRWFGPGSN